MAFSGDHTLQHWLAGFFFALAAALPSLLGGISREDAPACFLRMERLWGAMARQHATTGTPALDRSRLRFEEPLTCPHGDAPYALARGKLCCGDSSNHLAIGRERSCRTSSGWLAETATLAAGSTTIGPWLAETASDGTVTVTGRLPLWRTIAYSLLGGLLLLFTLREIYEREPFYAVVGLICTTIVALPLFVLAPTMAVDPHGNIDFRWPFPRQVRQEHVLAVSPQKDAVMLLFRGEEGVTARAVQVTCREDARALAHLLRR